MEILFGIAIGIVLGGFVVAFIAGAKISERVAEAFSAGVKEGEKQAAPEVFEAHRMGALIAGLPIVVSDYLPEGKLFMAQKTLDSFKHNPDDCPEEATR